MIRAAMRRVFDQAEQLVRARVQEMPDGPCYTVAWPGTPKETVLYDRQAHVGPPARRARAGPLFAGDTVSVRSGGGGGWGDPLQRDPALVADEAKNELISVETAREVYGVVLDPETLAVDEAATREERERRRAGSG